MKTKVCFKCGGDPQPLSNFYKHKMMADGHLNKCKTCTKKDATDSRNKRLEYYREYDRRRGATPERIKACTEVVRRWRQKNPRKYAAELLFNNRRPTDARLTPKPCKRCGAEKVHGHHELYDKPLEVVWLCAKCHKVRHKEMKALGIEP